MQNIHTDEMNWIRAIPGELPHRDQIHVWRVPLDIPECQKEQLLALLADDEMERAEKFHFKSDKDRFIVARGMLRKILASYTGSRPQDLRFDYSSYGKPALAAGSGSEALRFNLSHSGGYALYAVTRDRHVGIDIEQIRVDIDAEQISRRFFSEQEIRSLHMVPLHDRAGLFFQIWTRKEAVIKALGKGVSIPLEDCDVSLLHGACFLPVTVSNGEPDPCMWYGQDLYPCMGYAGAVVVEGGDFELSCRQYSL